MDTQLALEGSVPGIMWRWLGRAHGSGAMRMQWEEVVPSQAAASCPISSTDSPVGAAI